MIVVGVDPGTSGAIAVVCSVRGLLECARMPVVDRSGAKAKRALRFVDGVGLRDQIRHWSSVHRFAADEVCAVMEQTAAFPTMTGHAGHQMGHSSGIIEGVLSVMIDTPQMVKPAVWKKRFGLSSDKSESVAAVRRIYGDQVPKQFGHDKAEAVLLARWWMLENN